MPNPLTLVGTYGSPYSLKMRAVLRYRQIPFRWAIQGTADEQGIPRPKVAIIPVLGFPDDAGDVTEVMVDSTPQIARLETMFRSAVSSQQMRPFTSWTCLSRTMPMSGSPR